MQYDSSPFLPFSSPSFCSGFNSSPTLFTLGVTRYSVPAGPKITRMQGTPSTTLPVTSHGSRSFPHACTPARRSLAYLTRSASLPSLPTPSSTDGVIQPLTPPTPHLLIPYGVAGHSPYPFFLSLFMYFVFSSIACIFLLTSRRSLICVAFISFPSHSFIPFECLLILIFRTLLFNPSERERERHQRERPERR